MAITDYLSKIQFLANQNLDLLEAFSKSFNTNDSYVELNITTDEDDKTSATYLIPSFVTINNQLNNITNSISSITNVDEKGFAKIDVGSNSKMINTLGYLTAPMPVDLDLPSPDENLSNNFLAINNHLLKDYVFPNVSLKFNLNSIQNIVKDVVVRKVVFKTTNTNAINNIVVNNDKEVTDNIINSSKNSDGVFAYKEYFKKIDFETLYKALNASNLKEDIDYEIYDKVYRLPRREVNYFGEYLIETINNSYVAGDLNQVYELTLKNLTEGASNDLNNQLTYRIIDEDYKNFGVESLKVGDILISYDRQIKFKVLNINGNKLTIKVLNNQYITFSNTKDAANVTKSVENTLLFFAPSQSVMNNIENESVDGIDTNNPNNVTNVSFDKYKYLNVPLEENQFICIFIAPIFSETNVQAIFGEGVFLNTYKLSITDSINNNTYFKEYYNTQVLNIGDQIKDMAECFNGAFSFLSKEQIVALKTLKAMTARSVTENNKSVIKPIINGAVSISNEVFYNNTSVQSQIEEKQNFIETQYNAIDTANANIQAAQEALKTASNSININNLNKIIDDNTKDKVSYNQNIQSALEDIKDLLNNSGAAVILEPVHYCFNGAIDVLSIEKILRDNGTLPERVNIIGFEVYYQYFTDDGNNQTTIDSITGQNVEGYTGSATYSLTNWTKMVNPTYYYKDINYNAAKNSLSYRRDYPSLTFPDYFKTSLENHFNNVKIPVYPGMKVQVKYKYIYSTGYPFIRFTSDWNDDNIVLYFTENGTENGAEIKEIQTISSLLQYIEENQNKVDIVNTLNEYGVIDHVLDSSIIDGKTYYHNADNILYNNLTSVQNIINNLANKIQELDNQYSAVKSLKVSIEDEFTDSEFPMYLDMNTKNEFRLSVGYSQDTQGVAKFNMETITFPFNDCSYNKFIRVVCEGDESIANNNLKNYIKFIANDGSTNEFGKPNTMLGAPLLDCNTDESHSNDLVFNKMKLKIGLHNTSNADMKIYTLFPKGRNNITSSGYNDITDLTAEVGKYTRYDYGAYIAEKTNNESKYFNGFLFKDKNLDNTNYDVIINNTGDLNPRLKNTTGLSPQELNQYVYFRVYNLYDGDANMTASAYNNKINGFTNTKDCKFQVLSSTPEKKTIEIYENTVIPPSTVGTYTVTKNNSKDNKNHLFVWAQLFGNGDNDKPLREQNKRNLMPLSLFQSPKYFNLNWPGQNDRNLDEEYDYQIGINKCRFDEAICNYLAYSYDNEYATKSRISISSDSWKTGWQNAFTDDYNKNRWNSWLDYIQDDKDENVNNGYSHLSLVPYVDGTDDMMCNDDGSITIPALQTKYIHVMAYYCIFYYYYQKDNPIKKLRTNVLLAPNNTAEGAKENGKILLENDETIKGNSAINYSNLDISQTLQFDILPSLYQDPQTYTVEIVAHLPENGDAGNNNKITYDKTTGERDINAAAKQLISGISGISNALLVTNTPDSSSNTNRLGSNTISSNSENLNNAVARS